MRNRLMKCVLVSLLVFIMGMLEPMIPVYAGEFQDAIESNGIMVSDESVTYDADMQNESSSEKIIVLDPCGGTLIQPNIVRTVGAPYGNIPVPEAPSADKVFCGWFTGPEDNDEVERITPVSIVKNDGSATLYAIWDEIASEGKCGENATYKYTKNTRTLIISGTGEMYDYTGDVEIPWMIIPLNFSGRYLTVEEGITGIGDNAFNYGYALRSISLPSSIKHIGAQGFGRLGAKEIVLPEGLEDMGEGVFTESKLKKIIIPANSKLTKISDFAFANSLDLEDIELPDGITEIGKYAFEYTKLKNITLPLKVKTIGEGAFYGCSVLENADIRSAEVIKDLAFCNCTLLSNVELPSNLKKIEGVYDELHDSGCAFGCCRSLKEILIPDGATSIGFNAFWECTGLEKITIPKSVVTIDESAFYDCKNLTIYCYKNSAAEKLAQKKKIPFVIIGSGGQDKPNNADISKKKFFEVTYLASDGFVYTGKPIIPSVTVRNKADNTYLTEGIDFSVSYSNNVKPGTAKIVVQGIGGCKGKVTLKFKIEKYDISNEEIFLYDPYMLDDSGAPEETDTFVYRKGGVTPWVNLYVPGDEIRQTEDGMTEVGVIALTAGRDYKASYKNNKKVWQGGDEKKKPSVIVKGIGCYKGSATVYFSICPQPLGTLDSSCVIVPDVSYSTKKNAWQSKPLLYDGNGKKLGAGTDYEKIITYTGEDGEKITEIPQIGEVVNVTIIGKGAYAAPDGQEADDENIYHTSYRIIDPDKNINSSKAKFRINDKKLDMPVVELEAEDFIEAKAPDGTVLKLTEEGDEEDGFYIVRYDNNKKAGTAKVTVRGTGSYGGVKTISFKIKK